jgi:hypothetical protein
MGEAGPGRLAMNEAMGVARERVIDTELEPRGKIFYVQVFAVPESLDPAFGQGISKKIRHTLA